MEKTHIKALKSFKLNRKTMAIYSDLESEFQMIDYSPTHSQLLIRSMKNKNRDYNIDIIMKGVIYTLISTTYKGIEISIAELNDIRSNLLEDFGFKVTRDYRVFSLKDSDGKTFFLNAMCFGVYHNKLEILETSIGRYDVENFGEDILWYAD